MPAQDAGAEGRPSRTPLLALSFFLFAHCCTYSPFSNSQGDSGWDSPAPDPPPPRPPFVRWCARHSRGGGWGVGVGEGFALTGQLQAAGPSRDLKGGRGVRKHSVCREV